MTASGDELERIKVAEALHWWHLLDQAVKLDAARRSQPADVAGRERSGGNITRETDAEMSGDRMHRTPVR